MTTRTRTIIDPGVFAVDWGEHTTVEWHLTKTWEEHQKNCDERGDDPLKHKLTIEIVTDGKD